MGKIGQYALKRVCSSADVIKLSALLKNCAERWPSLVRGGPTGRCEQSRGGLMVSQAKNERTVTCRLGIRVGFRR